MVKKIVVVLALGVIMCSAVGCGQDEEKERIKTGEEIALEQAQKAKDAVEDVNQQTMQIGGAGEAVEAEE